MSTDEKINPAVLEWARTSAGLSLDEAARRLGLASGPRGTGEEKLAEIEAGEREPTAAQISKMASVYHRPLIAFYMEEPPRPAPRVEDFRTMTEAAHHDDTARLEALVRDVRVRQSILKDIMLDEEGSEPVAFVGSIDQDTSVEEAAGRVRIALEIDDDRGLRRGISSAEDLFRELRRRTERLGIFVLVLGDLGSHHTAISAAAFRGLAIADPLAPIVVINDQDAKAAWSFTLIHELAHVFLGRTGISGAPSTGEPRTSQARIERFCNDVAGEVLLPERLLAGTPRLASADQLVAAADALSETWKVSSSMAAYRLWRTRKTDADTYGEAVAVLAARWRRIREAEKAQKSDPTPGMYLILRRRSLGEAMLRFVGTSLRENLVTHTTAARVFGVKAGTVNALLSGVSGLGGGKRPARREV